jgi:hypothetical protein
MEQAHIKMIGQADNEHLDIRDAKQKQYPLNFSICISA